MAVKPFTKATGTTETELLIFKLHVPLSQLFFGILFDLYFWRGWVFICLGGFCVFGFSWVFLGGFFLVVSWGFSQCVLSALCFHSLRTSFGTGLE